MNRLLIIWLVLIPFGLQAQVPRVASGRIQRLDSFPSHYIQAKNIDIWLPGNYSPDQKYAVLYMHDGQALYDSTITWNHQEWQVDECLGRLLKNPKVQACIVVGIWNHSKQRFGEYFPQKVLALLDTATQKVLERLMQGPPKADDYLKFLVTELKPYIDSHYSTFPDPAHTFVAGSSMGGLISLYALCEYPGVFGGAACLSTHWPGLFYLKGNPVPDALLQYMAEKLPPPAGHRIYFDHGDQTLDSLYAGPQQKADKIMRQKGYDSGHRMSRVFPGADHSERSWARRLEIPLEFLLKK